MKWGGRRKVKGCGVIKREAKWIREEKRIKKCGFDFDFGVLQIGEVELDQVDGMRKNLDEKTFVVLRMSRKGLMLLHVFL